MSTKEFKEIVISSIINDPKSWIAKNDDIYYIDNKDLEISIWTSNGFISYEIIKYQECGRNLAEFNIFEKIYLWYYVSKILRRERYNYGNNNTELTDFTNSVPGYKQHKRQNRIDNLLNQNNEN